MYSIKLFTYSWGVAYQKVQKSEEGEEERRGEEERKEERRRRKMLQSTPLRLSWSSAR